MSTDRQILTAIASTTRQKMRFFEIVQIIWGPDKKRCVLAVGQHSISLLRQDLTELVNPLSKFEYNNIVKVVKDKGSDEHFLLALDDSQSWKSDRILVKSENRELLLQHIQSCWQTHMMFKLSRTMMFPLSNFALTKPLFVPHVEPFFGYEWDKYRGYKFMKSDTFTPQPNMIQTRDTGEYAETSTGIALKVQVHDVMTFDQLRAAKREHIRWVAVEYKAKLVQDEHQFYVLRSGQRPKRMNLCGDGAAWVAWELIVRTRDYTIICQLLRREFIPPLCDCAQDISLIFKCPAEQWSQYEIQLMLQAQLMADSVCSTSTPSVYRELVQAKLDALRFDEDGIEWIGNYQRLFSRWKVQAIQFVQSIVQIYVKQNLLPAELLSTRHFLAQQTLHSDWSDVTLIDDWPAWFETLKRYSADFVDGGDDKIDAANAQERVGNRWITRLARYFAWAVDGGFLGAHFNLEFMIEGMTQLEDDRVVQTALMFMLHMRDQDMTLPWMEEKINDRLKDGGADNYMFNDRVMQWIIHGEYLRKLFGRHKEGEYFKSLAQILKTSAGTNLKAYICRIFMEMRVAGPGGGGGGRPDEDANVAAVPALLHLIQSGGVYLATFASAALVNLSHDNEMVKMMLMSQGLAQAAAKNIKSKDDDLICYTLTLMVNLTKEAHHRYIMANAGVLPLLYDLLTSCYHQIRHAANAPSNLSSVMSYSAVKEKILANISSLVGHFCKDEEYRDKICDMFPHTIKCLCYIATHGAGGTPLMSKVMYALKQLCATRAEHKMYVGTTVLKPLLQDQLKNYEVLQKAKPEFLLHSILLLQMLSSFKDNCIRIDDVDGTTIMMNMLKLPTEKLSDQLKGILRSLVDRVRDVINREHDIAAGV
mmetsp:Transcript_7364/g.18762  ORF Transcript_7364/g.18762 Transcript_7364/m.18762 type:complete len:873 (-) Transcript_7364:30-2648(-)